MGHSKGVVIPNSENGSGPKLAPTFFVHDMGRACVTGIRFLIKEAGEVIEFGTAAIVQNDGTTKKTKKR